MGDVPRLAFGDVDSALGVLIAFAGAVLDELDEDGAVKTWAVGLMVELVALLEPAPGLGAALDAGGVLSDEEASNAPRFWMMTANTSSDTKPTIQGSVRRQNKSSDAAGLVESGLG